MGGPNMLTYKKQYGMGGDKENKPNLENLKLKALDRVQTFQPILARGGMDHLIEFIPESDPPKLRWNLGVLQQLDIGQLISIAGVLENRMEIQTRQY